MKYTLNVLYQSNDYYAPITGVSMTSLMESNKDIDEINFFLLNDEISKDNLTKMEAVCAQYGRGITIIDAEDILSRFRDEFGVMPFKGTYTTYFKLLAIKHLPLPTDRLLHLDGDTVITGSLKPLCEMDLDGYIMAATYDCMMNDYKALVGIPLTDKYYNCGVMLVNHPMWISERCEEQIADHLINSRTGYYLVDQDILNVLFRKKTKYLEIKYNFNSGFYMYGIKASYKIYKLKEEYYSTYDEVSEAYKGPVIYHCMGAMTGRPWEQDSIHPQNGLFDKYLQISPWKDMEKSKPKRKFVFKVQRFLYKLLPRGIYVYFHQFGYKRYLKNMNKTAQERLYV